MRISTLLVSSALVLGLSAPGCQKSANGGHDYSPTTPAEPAATEATPLIGGDQLTRVLEMHDSYLTLITARDAAAHGETDVSRELLTEIATQPMPEGVSSVWAPEVLALHVAAGRGARAERAEGVAQGIASAAQSCGSCHASTGYSPMLAGQSEPPSPDSPSTLMKRHAWAAQQLWDALIIPSEDRWQQGATVLEQSKLEPQSLFDSEYVAEVGAERVHGLQAATKLVVDAEDWNARAEAYGELLHSCATCHGN